MILWMTLGMFLGSTLDELFNNENGYNTYYALAVLLFTT